MGTLRPREEWWPEAACQEAPTYIFFPEAGDPETAHWVAMFCAQCPVRTDCLEYALANRERWGIWGGKTETERRRILRLRNGGQAAMKRRPRPRKQAG